MVVNALFGEVVLLVYEVAKDVECLESEYDEGLMDAN